MEGRGDVQTGPSAPESDLQAKVTGGARATTIARCFPRGLLSTVHPAADRAAAMAIACAQVTVLGEKMGSLQQRLDRLDESVESVKSKTAETERRCVRVCSALSSPCILAKSCADCSNCGDQVERNAR